MRELLKTIKLDNLTPLSEFQRFCFGLSGAVTHEEFSENVRNFQAQDERYTAKLQDRILSSQEFLEVIRDPVWCSLAAKLMDVEIDDIKIVFPFFRVDLPQQFVDQEKKMSLPWHQEAGYYLPKGDCTPDSIVLSIALHDCNSTEGALLIACDTRKEVIQHKSVFMDSTGKKHLRVECPEPAESITTETKFGQVVAFDFKRPHRSGINSSNLVRLTLLLRATSNRELAQFNETTTFSKR